MHEVLGDKNLHWQKIIHRHDQKRFQGPKFWGIFMLFKSITKVLPVSRTEIHPIVWRWDGVWTVASDITSRQPWFWGTSVHCGLRWLLRLLCLERSHGTLWLAAWTAPPDTDTGRSDCAPLPREKMKDEKQLGFDFFNLTLLFAGVGKILFI